MMSAMLLKQQSRKHTPQGPHEAFIVAEVVAAAVVVGQCDPMHLSAMHSRMDVVLSNAAHMGWCAQERAIHTRGLRRTDGAQRTCVYGLRSVATHWHLSN
jgi:hypothetical protein